MTASIGQPHNERAPHSETSQEQPGEPAALCLPSLAERGATVTQQAGVRTENRHLATVTTLLGAKRRHSGVTAARRLACVWHEPGAPAGVVSLWGPCRSPQAWACLQPPLLRPPPKALGLRGGLEPSPLVPALGVAPRTSQPCLPEWDSRAGSSADVWAAL